MQNLRLDANTTGSEAPFNKGPGRLSTSSSLRNADVTPPVPHRKLGPQRVSLLSEKKLSLPGGLLSCKSEKWN